MAEKSSGKRICQMGFEYSTVKNLVLYMEAWYKKFFSLSFKNFIKISKFHHIPHHAVLDTENAIICSNVEEKCVTLSEQNQQCMKGKDCLQHQWISDTTLSYCEKTGIIDSSFKEKECSASYAENMTLSIQEEEVQR